MKLYRPTFAVLALLVLAVSIAAQQPAATAPTKPSGPPPLPKGKIAVINTGVFQQDIEEFKAKVDALNRQYEPRVKDIQGLADRISALETTLKSQSAVLSPAKVAEMTENLETMKRDYQRKGEDLQAEAGRERDKAFEPITGKLGKFAEDYTARNGIVVLVDIANAVQSGVVLWFDPRLDITKAFVAAYNKANPVTAAAAPKTPPKP